jgi:hypothetical protein
VGEGNRTGETSEAGWAELRLCDLDHEAGQIPKEEFKQQIEKELIGRETERNE